MKEINKSIKCSVHDCTYCIPKLNSCSKKKIRICNCSLEDTKEATMCDSYKKRKNDDD